MEELKGDWRFGKIKRRFRRMPETLVLETRIDAVAARHGVARRLWTGGGGSCEMVFAIGGADE